MLKNLLGASADDNDSNDPNPYDMPSAENAMAAAATSFLKQATETIANNIEHVNPPSFLPNAATVKKIAPFPLVDDDAGLLLANEAKDDANDTSALASEMDEDTIASQMLVQFPSYGTQSQALNKDSSSQWQEKTADWLLGGTSSIPTPKQQELQKQQLEQEKEKQQQQLEQGMLPTVEEESLPVEIEGNHPYHPTGSLKQTNPDAMTLVNSRDWSVDEQLLWKSSRFPPMDRIITTNDNANDNVNDNEKENANNAKHTFTTRNGEILTLKEHDVVFQPPLLEDPSRDFLAAYYYHVGVQPKVLDRLQEQETTLSSAIPTTTTSADPKTLRTLIQQHSSPYHLNHDIRKDLASLGGLTALPDEEKESDETSMLVSNSSTSAPLQSSTTGLLSDKTSNSTGLVTADKNNTSIGEVAWMPDRLCTTCYSCDTPFTVFRRRHHCRLCGQVFCNTCSGYFVPANTSSPHVVQPVTAIASPHKLYKAILPANNNNTTIPGGSEHGAITLRTCKMCFDQVTSRQQEQQKKQEAAAAALETAAHKRKSSSNNITSTEAIVAATPKRTTGGSTTTTTIATTAATPSVPKGTTSNNNTSTTTTASKSAIAGFEESSAFLRQWSKAIGAEGITSLATKTAGMVMDETQEAVAAAATAAANAVLPRSGVKPTQRQTSQTNLPAIGSTTSASSTELQPLLDRSSFVKEGNMHLGQTAASHLQQMTASLLESDAPLLWKSTDDDEASKKLRSKWVHKLMSLATRCCATVDTNVKKGDMLDIRPYVKIKVIPGGSCDDCTYMSGILFRKTGTNKQMPREIINPKIMLLSGGIEFTRTARIASLDTLLEQEDKYIEILVGKILKLEPDLLMVGKGVSRRAQELLLKNNVQLLQQVKASLLNRISRQTGATIISSTDHIMNQFGAHVLGKCHRFRFIVARDNESWVGDDNSESMPSSGGQYHIPSLLSNTKLSNHERQAALAANMLGEDILDGSEAIRSGLAKRGVTQTYALLEGCPKQLGCTVVLRGANKAALKQIKNVFRFLVSAAYNMKLEMSYLKERCARLRPDYVVQKRNLFSSSFCVDYGSPPNNRKIRPWNGGTNNEGIQRSISGQVTAFDHQSILITSVWMTDKTQCCPAEVKGICYYSMQDVSLGQFLRDSCFNLSLKCQNPSCKKSVLDHSLSFVHNDGLINITVDHMDEPLPPAPMEYSRHSDKQNDDDSEDLDDSPIATWTYCNETKQVVTPLTWLSENTWKYSFGKFLESSFYNRDTIVNSPLSSCQSPLQKSTTLFFGCGRLAAKFTYEQIRPFGVFVRKSLPIDTSFHRARALRHLEKISMGSSTLFVKFDKHIEKVAREARSVKRLSDNHHLQTVIMELSRISNEVDHAAKTLQEKIASVSETCLNDSEGAVNDAALFRFPWHARRFLFMLTSAWNEKLSAAGQAIVAMKKLSSASQRNDSGIGSNVPAIVAGDQSTEELNEGMRRLRQLHEVYSRYNLMDIQTVLPTIPGNTDHRAIETEFDDDFEDPDATIDFSGEVDADVLASRRRLYNTPHSVDTPRLGVRTLTTANSQIKQTPGATVKSAITRFFTRGGRERDPYVVDLGLFHDGRPRLEPGVNGIVVPVIDEQLSTVIAYSLSSKEYEIQFQNYSKIENSGPDAANGLGTPPSVPSRPPTDGNRSSSTDSQPNIRGSQSSATTSGKKSIERRMLVRNKSHIKHTFRDLDEKGQNLCKFVCTTYWATQFHAVREAFLSPTSKDSAINAPTQTSMDIEKSFIMSLSSAYSWAASGGKSGASFARTSDDRFVIKCISRTELQMFLDCAPAYFEYLSKAFFHGL